MPWHSDASAASAAAWAVSQATAAARRAFRSRGDAPAVSRADPSCSCLDRPSAAAIRVIQTSMGGRGRDHQTSDTEVLDAPLRCILTSPRLEVPLDLLNAIQNLLEAVGGVE